MATKLTIRLTFKLNTNERGLHTQIWALCHRVEAIDKFSEIVAMQPEQQSNEKLPKKCPWYLIASITYSYTQNFEAPVSICHMSRTRWSLVANPINYLLAWVISHAYRQNFVGLTVAGPIEKS